MAYPKSLLLIAFFLVATTSVANCQQIGASVLGILVCNTSFPIVVNPTAFNAEATLLCNGAPVAPAVKLDDLGIILIIVGVPNARLVNAANCTVIVTNVTPPFGGCPIVKSSQVLEAPIISITGGLLPTIGTFRIGIFRAVNRNVTSNV